MRTVFASKAESIVDAYRYPLDLVLANLVALPSNPKLLLATQLRLGELLGSPILIVVLLVLQGVPAAVRAMDLYNQIGILKGRVDRVALGYPAG